MTTTTTNADKVTLDQVLVLAQQLRPVDQARLVARLVPKVEAFLNQVKSRDASRIRQPLRGSFIELGAAPSAEDMDEVQREMWATVGQE